MKTNHIALLMVFLFGVAQAREPTWTDEDRDWEAKEVALWKDNLAKATTLPPTEKVDSLALGLQNMGHRASMVGHSLAVERIYDRLQKEFLTIPDHAKYFTDKIEEAYESHAVKVRKIVYPPDWETRVQKMIEAQGFESYQDWLRGAWGDCEEINAKNLGMLRHIPSTESVRALGHYLWERDEPDIKIERPKTGNLATDSLTEMIADGPMQSRLASWEDVPKWQKWFDEVKAGKRTFRFVGSDVDYTLDGPADAATLKRIKERNSSTQRPNIPKKHATPSETPVGTNQKGPVFHAGLLAAILFCLAALIYFFRRRHIG